MWISAEIFDWQARSEGGGKLGDELRCTRPYEILAHATQLLETANSSFARADVLSNLKRSLNSRLQHIEDVYQFSNLFSRRVGALERLELLGMAKPFLIKQLFELRNDVEHNDAKPPSSSRLRELTDIAWYFLRSTDPVCRLRSDQVVFSCNSGEFERYPALGFTAHLLPGDANSVEIAGWFSKILLHEEFIPNSLEINVTESRERPTSPLSEESVDQISFMFNRARNQDELWIEGGVLVPDHLIQKLWRIALRSNMA
jgi:hypothetical protein